MAPERTRAVCDGLIDAIATYVVPQQILTDNGKVFTGRFKHPPHPTQPQRCRVGACPPWHPPSRQPTLLRGYVHDAPTEVGTLLRGPGDRTTAPAMPLAQQDRTASRCTASPQTVTRPAPRHTRPTQLTTDSLYCQVVAGYP